MKRIMKIKEWLQWFKFRPSKPDIEGFKTHIQAWHQDGIPYELMDLQRIGRAYGCRDIEVKNGTIFVKPEMIPTHIEIKFQILPSGIKFLD